MRLAFLVFGLVSVSTGCSNYVTERVIPTGCIETTYYLDADQDGWGSQVDADGDGVADFERSCESKDPYTARNSLDCDDNNAQATGRIGSVCPENTVKGTNDYAAKVVGAREYAAVIGSNLSGSQAAAGQCGESSWGGRWGNEEAGGLATFPGMQGLFRLINEIDTKLSDKGQIHYAAWVGVVPSEDKTSWVFERNNSSLADDAEELFLPEQMGFCGGTAPPPATTERLALVRTFDSGDWCFGVPSDANPSGEEVVDVTYTDFAANFVCERPRPDVRCYVAQNDTPWLEPCTCRTARGEDEATLKKFYDPARLLAADTGLYSSKYDQKLCLDPSVTEEPAE